MFNLRQKNSADIRRLKITTEVVRTYYVMSGDWIYGGPFDTKEEARQYIEEAKRIDAEHPIP